ncbi:hypothetical protein KIPB_011546, partial [Kipferlia bialata]
AWLRVILDFCQPCHLLISAAVLPLLLPKHHNLLHSVNRRRRWINGAPFVLAPLVATFCLQMGALGVGCEDGSRDYCWVAYDADAWYKMLVCYAIFYLFCIVTIVGVLYTIYTVQNDRKAAQSLKNTKPVTVVCVDDSSPEVSLDPPVDTSSEESASSKGDSATDIEGDGGVGLAHPVDTQETETEDVEGQVDTQDVVAPHDRSHTLPAHMSKRFRRMFIMPVFSAIIWIPPAIRRLLQSMPSHTDENPVWPKIHMVCNFLYSVGLILLTCMNTQVWRRIMRRPSPY